MSDLEKSKAKLLLSRVVADRIARDATPPEVLGNAIYGFGTDKSREFSKGLQEGFWITAEVAAILIPFLLFAVLPFVLFALHTKP